ncbi:hypothetical protein AURDEDRAFT_167621 [Auricularia subglabra TFB-10046 SS5]|nr:hypothetical protein AURDEDRAFT_167621 [Auricularia subglabra TFB-10046 SS5]
MQQVCEGRDDNDEEPPRRGESAPTRAVVSHEREGDEGAAGEEQSEPDSTPGNVARAPERAVCGGVDDTVPGEKFHEAHPCTSNPRDICGGLGDDVDSEDEGVGSKNSDADEEGDCEWYAGEGDPYDYADPPVRAATVSDTPPPVARIPRTWAEEVFVFQPMAAATAFPRAVRIVPCNFPGA